MSKEIIQPNIGKPDLKDPFTWASICRTHEQWIRHVGPQLGIDVQKYVLGDVLANIIGDDANCFTWTVGGDFFDSQLAVGAKRNLLERLDWEASVPETPPQIKGRLRASHSAVSALDWANREEFSQARTQWYGLKQSVEQDMRRQPKLKEAEEYMLSISGQLSDHWQDFLNR